MIFESTMRSVYRNVPRPVSICAIALIRSPDRIGKITGSPCRRANSKRTRRISRAVSSCVCSFAAAITLF